MVQRTKQRHDAIAATDTRASKTEPDHNSQLDEPAKNAAPSKRHPTKRTRSSAKPATYHVKAHSSPRRPKSTSTKPLPDDSSRPAPEAEDRQAPSSNQTTTLLEDPQAAANPTEKANSATNQAPSTEEIPHQQQHASSSKQRSQQRPSVSQQNQSASRVFIARPRTPQGARRTVVDPNRRAGKPLTEEEVEIISKARDYDRSKYLSPQYHSHRNKQYKTQAQKSKERERKRRNESRLVRGIKNIQWPYLIGAVIVVSMVIVFLVKQG